eukprot:8473591-Ditylum_brightwellii.AAC.1
MLHGIDADAYTDDAGVFHMENLKSTCELLAKFFNGSRGIARNSTHSSVNGPSKRLTFLATGSYQRASSPRRK